MTEAQELLELKALVEELNISINDLDDIDVLCACSVCCQWQNRN